MIYIYIQQCTCLCDFVVNFETEIIRGELCGTIMFFELPSCTVLSCRLHMAYVHNASILSSAV